MRSSNHGPRCSRLLPHRRFRRCPLGSNRQRSHLPIHQRYTSAPHRDACTRCLPRRMPRTPSLSNRKDKPTKEPSASAYSPTTKGRRSSYLYLSRPQQTGSSRTSSATNSTPSSTSGATPRGDPSPPPTLSQHRLPPRRQRQPIRSLCD